MPKRFAFVNYGNSREGSAIADALKEEGYFVYATYQPDPKKLDHLKPAPLSVDQFIDSDKETILATIKQCHAVIYTILDTPKLANEIFTELAQDIGVKKTIVIISPIFTWGGEPRAQDWKKRWPHPKYADFLSAERYLTTLPLKLYVMCTGLLYGDGEGALLPLFQSAWSLNPVPILEENHNVIPTLHVKDMAHGAVAVLSSKPENPVFIAHDGSHTTQHDLIKAINTTFGAGRTTKTTDDQFISKYGREVIDWVKFDIELEAEEYAGLDFERHCSNPVEEMQTLVDEFVTHRLLKPLRIFAIDLDTALIDEIVKYYGVVNATDEKLKELFNNDKSEEAVALRESGNEEEEAPTLEIHKHVFANAPSLRNLGYIITKVPDNEESRESLFMEEDEVSAFIPKYILTSHEFGPLERWFISRGSHCCKVSNMEEVKKFLGLPRNFTREIRILEARRELEAIQSAEADAQRKEAKRQAEKEEEHRQELQRRDEELLAECEKELKSMQEIRSMDAKSYLMQKLVPIFIPPLAQISEARPDDPLRFLASHFEAEANKLKE